jgi:PAS domain S-box-containing protein
VAWRASASSLDRADNRLAISYGLLVLVLMLVVSLVASSSFLRLQGVEEDRLAGAIAAVLSDSISRVSFSGKYQARLLVEEMKARVPELDYISVEDLDGKVVANSDPSLDDTLVSIDRLAATRRALALGAPLVVERGRGNEVVKEIVAPYRGGLDSEVLGMVRVGIGVSDERRRQLASLLGLVALAAALTAFAIGAVLVLSRRFGGAIRNMALQLQGILDHAPLAIVVGDREGRSIAQSSEFSRLFGGPSEDRSLGQAFSSVLPAEPIEELQRLHDLVSGGEKMAGADMEVLIEGERREWQVSEFPVALDNRGRVDLACALIRDITEEKKAQKAIRDLNAELERKVARRTADLEESNSSLRKSNEELKRTLDALTVTQSRLVQSEKLAALGQLVAGLAHEINTPLGAISSSNGNILASLRGDLGELIAVSRSLDEAEAEAFLRLLDASLDRAADLSAGEDWSARKAAMARFAEMGQSVDLRTAEMIVELGLGAGGASLAELLPFRDRSRVLSAVHGAAMLRQGAEIVRDACEKATYVVQALRYYSYRDENDEDVELSVRKELGNLIALYRNKIKYGVEVVTDYADEGIVVGHRNRLNQVWMNLINNALQAMSNKGRLGLGIRRSGGRILVSVQDDGPGIPEDIQGRVFEPFFTTKALGEGTGLGLDICKKILQAHGADISFETGPGGTTFLVSLPAARPATEGGRAG